MNNFSSFIAAAQCAAVVGIVLFVPRQKGRKNAPRGLIPLGTPQCAVAGEINLAARRKSGQLQLLRLQVQKTCKHESSTQAPKQKALLYLTRPSLTKFQTNTISFLRLPLVVATLREMKKKHRCFSPLCSLKSGNARGFPGGNAWASFLSPFLCDEAKKWHLCYLRARAEGTV